MLRESTSFDVFYLDGTIKRFDILSITEKYPQFVQLLDRKLFEKAKLLGWSGISWNDELDIDAQTVYEKGLDVTCEYDSADITLARLGYKIKQKRLEQFMSQEELANKVGIDQSDLSKIEKGLLNPSVKIIDRIAHGLNSKIDISFE